MPTPEADFYVAPDGNDSWSGKLHTKDASGRDGPFATLARARDALRALPRDRDLTVLVRGGTYFLDEPLVFRPEDSGSESGRVIYAAFPGESPVLSGGRRITGWTRPKGGLWVAEVAGVNSGEWRFRQLFVNGSRRPRTRLPRQGFFRVAGLAGVDPGGNYQTPSGSFEFAQGDLRASWANLSDVEVVVLHFWVDTHLPIATIDEEKRLVTFTRKSRRRFTDDFNREGARYYVENVREALGAPGEWYLDRRLGVLSYVPKPGESPDRAEAIAPRLAQLVRLEGRPEEGRFVERIEFRGLTFSHTDWDLPPNDAGDIQAAVGVPGALYARGARHCRVERCTFSHLGTYGIELEDGCSDWEIARNEFADLAGGGVKITGGDASSPPARRTERIAVTDNHMHDLGATWHSAVGILLRHAAGCTLSWNHIHHLYYTGISAGWVWGYGPSVSRENKIESNLIHHVGQGLLSDMGGIYTLGVSPGTVIRGNVIHDVESWGYGGWGIYTDEGSSHILIEGNLVYRTKSAGFHQHYGRENVIRNNIFALGREAQLMRTRKEPHLSFTFERNIVYFKEGQLLGSNWDDDKYAFDYNLYWDARKQPLRFAKWSLEEWRKRGQDVHSILADPLFRDPERGDFALVQGSPASRIGFRPVDAKAAGPRKER